MARLQHAQIALALASTGTEPGRDARIAADRELIASLHGQLAALTGGSRAAVTGAPGGGSAAVAGTVAGAPAPPPARGFMPTHRVPAEGLPAWANPDPAGASTPLAGGLPLEVVGRAADWAQVRASNGWTGWVDARRLVTGS